jgi:hypothetical protein
MRLASENALDKSRMSSERQTAPENVAGASKTPSLRRRRWLRKIGASMVVLFALSLFGAWLLQPKQLVPLILNRTGKTLSLEITADSDAEARLRGEPQLLVRNLVVREPGTKTELLRADRLLIALPWSSLRSGGKDVTVERIELDAPRLNLTALQAWLSKRPPSEETTIPTLTDGLRIRDGRIDNDDWRIENIAVDLPELYPQREVNARVRGRYVDAPTAVSFDLAVALTRPANGAGLAVVGPLTIEGRDWRLPATATLSGPLRLGNDDLRIAPAKFGMTARYESGNTQVPFALGLHGPLHFDEATWALEPVTAILRGEGAVPNLNSTGAIALGRRLVLRLDGTMPAWPEPWPALPAPIGQSRSPLPFRLRYSGKPDVSEIIELGLARDAMRFESRFRLDAVLGWVEQSVGSPLPPLDGTLSAPKLEISGATLEGVEITLDDEAIR